MLAAHAAIVYLIVRALTTGGGWLAVAGLAVLELVATGIVEIDFRVAQEIDDLRSLMKKFATVPMSLADACLVRMTELERDFLVLTLDSDFRIYRRNRRQVVPTLMPDDLGGQ